MSAVLIEIIEFTIEADKALWFMKFYDLMLSSPSLKTNDGDLIHVNLDKKLKETSKYWI